MTDDAALFPGYEPPERPELDLSAGQRLTLRQSADIAAGRHPLTLTYTLVLPLHPNADRERDATSGRSDPLTCGSCVFRQRLGHHDYAYPKCTRPGAPISHGPATDVRAWWPACTHYEAKEG